MRIPNNINVQTTVGPANHKFVRKNKLHFSDMIRVGIEQKRKEFFYKERIEQFQRHWTKIRPKVILTLKKESVPYHGVTYNLVCTLLQYKFESEDITLDEVYDLFLKFYEQYLPGPDSSSMRGPTEEEIAKYPPGSKFKDTNSKQ